MHDTWPHVGLAGAVTDVERQTIRRISFRLLPMLVARYFIA